MDFVGLDIGSSSIKVAQVAHEGKAFRLLSLGRAKMPPVNLSSEAPKDHVAVAETIKKLLNSLNIKSHYVVVSLPEKDLASRVVKVPQMSEEELASSLRYEADAFVPFDLDDAVLRHQVIKEDEKTKKMTVFLVAAPKRLVNRYLDFVKLAGLEPLALETELLSLNRALTTPESDPVLLMNLGFKSCSFAISWQGKIYLTRSLPIAGEALTVALSRELQIDPSQAEEYKKAYGLEEKVLEGKIKKILSPLISSVTAEAKKAIQFFEEEEKQPVKQVILSGGTASLPNIASSFVAALGIETVVANPFSLLDFDQKAFASFLDEGPLYAVAIGLAKREV